MTPHLDIAVIGPDQRTRRVGELEAVRADLREHPLDVAPYHAELADVERELLELLAHPSGH
jgi:hypothetical protein